MFASRRFAIAAVSLCCLGLPGMAAAQEYPARPVRLIVPFPPGAATDILGRLLAQRLTEKWGQSVVVDNKPGAGSIVGAEAGAKAPADGYTIFMGHIGTHGANPALYARLPYDPVKDFAPVTLLVTVPNLLAVNPAVPANNVRELLEAARARPGALNVSTPGVGTSAHLILALFKSVTATDFTHVPYKGSVASMQGVMAGEAQATFDTITSVLPQARAGKVRVLAISSKERSPLAPEAVPLNEAGVAGFDVSTWFALFVPAGTPRAVIDRINAETVAAMKHRDTAERLQAQGMNIVGSSPDELGAHVTRELARWGKVVREANIKVE
jgi:tripartite-type tricarboxylate transporter receptor subunit TctC